MTMSVWSVRVCLNQMLDRSAGAPYLSLICAGVEGDDPAKAIKDLT